MSEDILERRHEVYGDTVREWVALVPGELDIDAVGLWQIVPAGRLSFGLSGDELDEYIRLNIRALLEAGALPVRHLPHSEYEWTVQRQYGTSHDEIAEAVVREWHDMPDDPLVLCGDGVWFARPHPGRKYVEM